MINNRGLEGLGGSWGRWGSWDCFGPQRAPRAQEVRQKLVRWTPHDYPPFTCGAHFEMCSVNKSIHMFVLTNDVRHGGGNNKNNNKTKETNRQATLTTQNVSSCHGNAMAVPWQCHCIAMALP